MIKHGLVDVIATMRRKRQITMGEMKNLYTQGVSDINSYLIGRANMREEIIEMIVKSLNNPALEVEKMTPRLALTVLVGAIKWNGDTESANFPTTSNE